MFFLSCSRHPSRKFTLVQEWNRPYSMCTYRISNVSLRSVDCDNLEINIIYSTKMKRMMQIINEIICQNIKRTISFNFTYYIREKELSTEKNYFSWGSIDKDGIHSIGRVYSRNVIFFIYISVSYIVFPRVRKERHTFFSNIFRCKRRSQSLFQTRNDDRHVHVDVKRSNTIILVGYRCTPRGIQCLSLCNKKEEKSHVSRRHTPSLSDAGKR